ALYWNCPRLCRPGHTRRRVGVGLHGRLAIDDTPFVLTGRNQPGNTDYLCDRHAEHSHAEHSHAEHSHAEHPDAEHPDAQHSHAAPPDAEHPDAEHPDAQHSHAERLYAQSQPVAVAETLEVAKSVGWLVPPPGPAHRPRRDRR